MKIIDPSATIELPMSGADILRHIERCGRICYKSEGRITENSADDFVRGIIKRGHEAVLEHASFSVKFVCVTVVCRMSLCGTAWHPTAKKAHATAITAKMALATRSPSSSPSIWTHTRTAMPSGGVPARRLKPPILICLIMDAPRRRHGRCCPTASKRRFT